MKSSQTWPNWLAITLTVFLSSACGATVIKLDTPDIAKQQEDQWCWAASIQNCLDTYHVKVEMVDVVKATYGRTVDLPIFSPSQAVINLLQASALVAPENKVVHPYFVPGPPVPAVLVQELSREQSPLLVMYANAGGGGHCVVCYGVEYLGPPNSPWQKPPFRGNRFLYQATQLTL